jgi:hypothetical protein
MMGRGRGSEAAHTEWGGRGEDVTNTEENEGETRGRGEGEGCRCGFSRTIGVSGRGGGPVRLKAHLPGVRESRGNGRSRLGSRSHRRE